MWVIPRAGPSCRAVKGVDLRPLSCCYCGFESRRKYACLSVVSVVCCQVEVSATDWSLVHRSPTECGVSECDCEVRIMRRSWPTKYCCTTGEKKQYSSFCIQKSRYFLSTLSISLIPYLTKNPCSVDITVSEMTSVPNHAFIVSRSQESRRLRRRSADARLLRLRIRIPTGSYMFVSCVCCVLYRYWSLRSADPSSRGVLSCGECMSLSVIRCKYIPQNQWVSRRGQTKKKYINSQADISPCVVKTI